MHVHVDGNDASHCHVYIEESRGARRAVRIVCAPSGLCWKFGCAEPGNAACLLTRACAGSDARWGGSLTSSESCGTERLGARSRVSCAARLSKNLTSSCAASRRTAQIFGAACEIQIPRRRNSPAAKNGCFVSFPQRDKNQDDCCYRHCTTPVAVDESYDFAVPRMPRRASQGTEHMCLGAEF